MADREPEIRRALGIVRVIWAIAAGSQGLLLLAAIAVVGQVGGPLASEHHLVLLAASLGALVGGTLLAYFTRNQLYKRYWRGHAIAPRGYVTGNVVLLVLLAGTSTLALVSAIVVKAVLPYVLISGVAMVLMLLNVPRGRPMLPHEPRFGARW